MASWTVPSAQQTFAMEVIKGRVPSHPFPRDGAQAASFQREMDIQRREIEDKIEAGAQRLVDDAKALIAQGQQLAPTVARGLVKLHSDRFTPEELAALDRSAQLPVDVRTEMLAMAPKFSVGSRIRGEGVWEKRGTIEHAVVTKVRANRSYTIKLCDTDSDGAVLWDGPFTDTAVMTPFGYSHGMTFSWKAMS